MSESMYVNTDTHSLTNLTLSPKQSIEKCFSREVNVLITNQGVAKDYERLHSKVVSVSGASPTTPSPFNLASIKSVDSPQPESSGDAASRKPVSNIY